MERSYMFSRDLMPLLSGEICAEGMTSSPTSKKTFKSTWKRHPNRLQEWEAWDLFSWDLMLSLSPS